MEHITNGKKSKNQFLKISGAGPLFLLPSAAGFIIFFIWPFLSSLKYSLFDRAMGRSFAGLTNYAELISNPAYLKGLFNTLRFLGLCIPLSMLCSFSMALALQKNKYKTLFTLIFLIPKVIPSGSISFFWNSLFASNGYLNGLITVMGFEAVDWLESASSMGVIVLIFIWKNLGYNMILFLSGLSSVPVEYYEASKMDGAGYFNTLIHITVPCMAPTFVIVLIMSVINSFKVFKEIYLLTGSHPNENIYMLQHFMNNLFNNLNYPKLGAASVFLVFAIGILSVLFLKTERKAAGYE